MARAALERLRARKPVFGAVQSLANPSLTELAIWSGFDFVILDCEHGVLDESAHLASLQAVGSHGAFVVVRVRRGDFGAVGRYLEWGADGILMPDVDTAATAGAFVAAATLGSRGTRSSSGSGGRAGYYGTRKAVSREAPLLMAMIESGAAVTNSHAIAATEGLSGLVIGPHDLSADLDCPKDFANAAYQGAFAEVEQAALSAGVLLGSGIHPGFSVARLLRGGHRFIQVSADILALRDGYRAHLAAVEEWKTAT